MDKLELARHHNWAPTPRELSALQYLVEEDRKTLEILYRKREKCGALLHEASENMFLQEGRIKEVEPGKLLADQLSAALDQCLALVGGIKKDDPIFQVSAISDGQDAVHLEKAQHLMQQVDGTFALLQGESEKTQMLVREETDTLIVAKEEYQGALAMRRFTKEDLQKCESRIKETEAALKPNVERISAVKRFSDLIWTNIFLLATTYSFEVWNQKAWTEEASPKGFWRRLLHFQAVCRRWRLIIQSQPELWQHPLLIIGDKNNRSERLLEYHIKFGKGRFKELALTANFSYATIPDSLKATLREVKSIGILMCDFTKVRSINVQAWWTIIPPIQELHIMDSSGSSTQLPASLCGSIQKVTTRSVSVMFQGETPNLEEFRIINPTGQFSRNLNVTEIRRFLRRNCRNLRVFEATGSLMRVTNPAGEATDQDEDALDQLQEVKMSLKALVTLIESKYQLRSLQKIHISSLSGVTTEEWEQFLEIGQRRLNIQHVSIASMNDVDDALKVIPILNALKRIKVLEISGESVHPILLARISTLSSQPTTDLSANLSNLSTLERLVISSYNGPGEAIVMLIEETRTARKRLMSNTEDGAKIKPSSPLFSYYLPFQVDLLECPKIPGPIRTLIEHSTLT